MNFSVTTKSPSRISIMSPTRESERARDLPDPTDRGIDLFVVSDCLRDAAHQSPTSPTTPIILYQVPAQVALQQSHGKSQAKSWLPAKRNMVKTPTR